LFDAIRISQEIEPMIIRVLRKAEDGIDAAYGNFKFLFSTNIKSTAIPLTIYYNSAQP